MGRGACGIVSSSPQPVSVASRDGGFFEGTSLKRLFKPDRDYVERDPSG